MQESRSPTELRPQAASGAAAEVVEVLPLVQEELRIEKRRVTTGTVRVRSIVDMVEAVARATLEEETVEVTRVPVGAQIDEVPQMRTEGDTTIIPVVEEVLVVEKRLVLKEELHIRRRVKSEEVGIPVLLRKQRAVVERLPPDESGLSAVRDA